MLGVPATVSRITRAWAKWRGSASLLASRVTSWLPTNVSGRNAAAKLSCRSSAQASSKKLPSFRELQMAFHSSYWVTLSRPPSRIAATKPPLDGFGDGGARLLKAAHSIVGERQVVLHLRPFRG